MAVSEARRTPISLIRGGSSYWIQEKSRLIRPHAWDLQRRVPFAIVIAWLPLVVLAAQHGGSQDVRALLTDYRVYARVFIAIPLLLVGQVFMELRFREMAQHFLDASIVRLEDLPQFHDIIRKMRRLRDAKVPELLALAAVYVQGAYMMGSGRLVFASWAIEPGTRMPTPAGYYSVLITQALFLLLLGVALWKWIIWIYVLWRLSRMPLQLDATNGDLTAGLGFLSEVPRAFVPVVLAMSTVIGANWRSQVLTGQVSLDALKWPAAVFVVIVVAVFFLPLAMFSPKLLQEKRLSLLRYGSLQHLFSLQFRKKWARRSTREEDLLGVPDFSALADLSSGFKNIDQMFSYPLSKSTLIAFAAALAVPMIPVITTQIPLRDVIEGLFDALH